jgi:hypothetical protein
VRAEPDAALDEDDFRAAIERFLDGLDPDRVHPPGEPSSMEYQSGGLTVVAHAVAKKARARGTQQQVVANPVPAFAFYGD